MADMPTEGVSPVLMRVNVRLDGDVLSSFDAFLRKMGWAVEDAARILLAYPAAVARGRALSPEEVRDELGAARAELATLRHRAYSADEAIRTLEMNVTGFSAALRQFEKSLPVLERDEENFRRQLETLLLEAAQRGVVVEPEEPEPVASVRSLLDFFRRHTDASNSRE